MNGNGVSKRQDSPSKIELDCTVQKSTWPESRSKFPSAYVFWKCHGRKGKLCLVFGKHGKNNPPTDEALNQIKKGVKEQREKERCKSGQQRNNEININDLV